MKKIIIFGLIILCLLSCVACGETVTNEYGQKVMDFGPYVGISKEQGKDDAGNGYNIYLIYEEDTKIVYRFLTTAYRAALTPYYIIGEDGTAHMTKWEDGKIVEIPNP